MTPSTPSAPLVSVVIPTYNSARWLPLALESVWAQTYRPFEVIVIDDGSTDDTLDILEGYGARLRFMRLGENRGPSAARNAGVQIARGECIAFLDADDLWFPTMLTATVQYLQANPGVDLVFGGWGRIDMNGRLLPLSKFRPDFRKMPSTQQQWVEQMLRGTMFPVGSFVLRTHCFGCCSGFNDDLAGWEDWELFVRLLLHGHTFGCISELIVQFRRHPGNSTVNIPRMREGFLAALNSIFGRADLPETYATQKSYIYCRNWLGLAGLAFEAGDTASMRDALREALNQFSTAPLSHEMAESCVSNVPPAQLSRTFIEVAAKSFRGVLAHKIRGYGYQVCARRCLENRQWIQGTKWALMSFWQWPAGIASAMAHRLVRGSRSVWWN